MPINEMFIFYHQSLLSMAQTLEKSTGHERLSGAFFKVIVIFLLNKHTNNKRIVCYYFVRLFKLSI